MRIAVHECGHTVMAFRHGHTVHQVALGACEGSVTRTNAIAEGTIAEFEAELDILLGGRAAEEILLSDISAGAGGPVESDLARATQLALNLELRFGLGQIGNLWLPMPLELALRDPVLTSTIRHRLDRAYDRARAEITAKAPLVRAMADTLVEARELSDQNLAAWSELAHEMNEADLLDDIGTVVPFPTG